MILEKTKHFDKVVYYGGNAPEKIMRAFCYNCQKEHEIPHKDWAVGFVKKNVFTVCVESLSPEQEGRG